MVSEFLFYSRLQDDFSPLMSRGNETLLSLSAGAFEESEVVRRLLKRLSSGAVPRLA